MLQDLVPIRHTRQTTRFGSKPMARILMMAGYLLLIGLQ